MPSGQGARRTPRTQHGSCNTKNTLSPCHATEKQPTPPVQARLHAGARLQMPNALVNNLAATLQSGSDRGATSC
jgi:hypothetical protein